MGAGDVQLLVPWEGFGTPRGVEGMGAASVQLEVSARLAALRGWGGVCTTGGFGTPGGVEGMGRRLYNWRFRHAWRRRDDVDIVCTTVGFGGCLYMGGVWWCGE